jgi:lipopolysaccharide transport system ATP-binding protein
VSGHAIVVEDLAKSYRVGRALGQDTLRDQIAYSTRRFATGWTASGRRARSSARTENTLWALDGVSFEIAEGEVTGVLGQNGAGKSTLLKILARITDPTRGRARVRGRVGSLLEVGTGFHPELTGRENVFLNGAILGLRRREIERQFDSIVAFAEVERFIDTPVKRYSSGMQLRLAFGVAAHIEPEILLVDEVLAVGDTAFQRKCLGKIGEITQSGRTVLFVTHNLPSARQLCTRGIWLKQGRVAATGPFSEVLERYLDDLDAGAGEDVFPARPAELATFRRVRVCNDAGMATATVGHSEPFVLELEYDVTRPLVGGRLIWVLDRADGTCVLGSGSHDSPELFPPDHSPGSYRASVRFPGGLLNPGIHHCRIAIKGETGFHSYDARQCGVFMVTDDTDYAAVMPGGRDGALLQRLEWQRERLD